MGFSWTPITQYITEFAAAHQNEIKANVDIVYSDLALSQYDWQYLPVSTDEEILHEHFKEMRDAIDYADDMNYGRSHNAGYKANDKTTHRATVHSDENSGYDATHDIGVDSGYDSTVYSGEDSPVDSWHEANVQADYQIYVYTGQNETYQSGYG